MELGRRITGTPREAEISQRAVKNGAALVQQYILDNTKDGRLYLATDQAKRLFPEYLADPTGWNEDVSQAAAAVAHAARRSALAELPEPGKDVAKITVGSPASGKTSSILGPDDPATGIVLESIPQDIGYLDGLAQQFAASGRRPQVDFTFTSDVRQNVQRMVERAKKTGRVVPIDHLANGWVRVPKAVAAFAAKFGDKAPIRIFDNTGAKGQQQIYTGDAQSVVDQYGTTEQAAREAARGELKRLYDAGEVPEAIYRAALSDFGGYPPSYGGGPRSGGPVGGNGTGKPASQLAGGLQP